MSRHPRRPTGRLEARSRRVRRLRRLRPAGLVLPALAVLTLAAGCAASDAGTGDPLTVGAASDLLPAFTELGEMFEQRTGEEVTFVFGSSGQLAHQVIEGAPIDLFASADAALVDRVLDAGAGDPDSRTHYADGRVVIWAPAERWGGWHDLAALADDETITTLALANPEHAPYGRAAREAMTTAGVWSALQPAVVYGENITDTYRLVASGNADVGLIALSLALAAEQDGDGRWVLLDEHLHEPLRQETVVITDDPDRGTQADRFVDLVASDQGREVMRRYGLLLPGEPPPPDRDGTATAAGTG